MFKLTILCVALLAIRDASSQTLGKCGGYCPTQFTYVNNPFFKVLGTLNGIDKCGTRYQKAYFYPRYISATWIEAKAICQTYGMELASFKTLAEANAVITLVEMNADLKNRDNLWIFINGVALAAQSKTEWYWTDSGQKIDFVIPWLINQPDTNGGTEWFLSIGKHNKEQRTAFNDIPGNNFVGIFLCQRCA
ncbi:unnamed protein product [Chironomus riparius]|uniref:C-type lectin domain-containing protein n=1 Tax=Chironomus riparius TaxID=315576 RepID=A0A9N9RKV8_9DIPT|nr:unnamed protein product [Chironomus riparius]